LLVGFSGFSQNQFTPTVIGSSGNETAVGASGNSFQYTLGETFVTTQTGSSNSFTQGFHQAFSSVVEVTPLKIVFSTQDASCTSLADGFIGIDTLVGCTPGYVVELNGEITDSLHFENLEAGTYDFTFTSEGGCVFDTTITLINLGEDCGLTFYNAISPNGNGKNDTWVINLIEANHDNTVQIFNRWGSVVWNATGYDNTNVVWTGNSNAGDPLPDGTYYYVVTTTSDNHTGFVEITR
jgi:gliding motility-associated-like protein